MSTNAQYCPAHGVYQGIWCGECASHANFVEPAPRDRGWVCPKCGSVYAPYVPSCYQCSRKALT